MGTRRAPTLLLFAACAFFSASAEADEIPASDGHVTDKVHALSKEDKKNIEDKLGKLQKEVYVDVAGWVVDAEDDVVDDMGNEAYAKWKVGRGYDNGLLFVFPKAGPVHVIQNHDKPELTPGEVTRVVRAGKVDMAMAERVDAATEAATKILRVKCLRPRPRGATDPARGRLYGAATALVLLAAIVMTLRGRRAQPVA